MTQLHRAVNAGNAAEVRKLLTESRRDINTFDEDKKRPLDYALEKQNIVVIKILLEFNAFCQDYCTPQEDSDITALLIRNGCFDGTPCKRLLLTYAEATQAGYTVEPTPEGQTLSLGATVLGALHDIGSKVLF